MRNNTAALKHPTIKRKLRQAIWLAKLEAVRKRIDGYGFARGVQYVENRHGNNIMRVDYYAEAGKDTKIIVYGDCSRVITDMVLQALAE